MGRNKDAATSYGRAVELLEQLLKENYDEHEATTLGGVYCNLGLLNQEQNSAAALEWFGKSISSLTAIIKKPGPKHPITGQFLFNALESRAANYLKMSKFAEALADYDAAIPLARPDKRKEMKINRARCLALTGKHVEARAFVSQLEDDKNQPADLPFMAACILTQSAKYASQDATLKPEEREQLPKQDFANALKWLQKAQQLGYFSGPDNLADLDQFSDLAPLRLTPNYQRWRESLTKNK
jgi:tetratricopeptide (TPR) repeat protein